MYANFFAPPPGLAPKKTASTPCRNFFFTKRKFFTVCYLNLHIPFICYIL